VAGTPLLSVMTGKLLLVALRVALLKRSVTVGGKALVDTYTDTVRVQLLTLSVTAKYSTALLPGRGLVTVNVLVA